MTQDFYRYPTPEYKWNYVDELVCGYNDAPGRQGGREGGVGGMWADVSFKPDCSSFHLPFRHTSLLLSLPFFFLEDLLRPETKYRRKLYAMCPQEEDEEEGGTEGGREGGGAGLEMESDAMLTFRLLVEPCPLNQ